LPHRAANRVGLVSLPLTAARVAPRLTKDGNYAVLSFGERFPMVASVSFADFLREQFAPLGGITLRRMFTKTGVFCEGVMLGMVTQNTLYFRVDDQNRAIFKEAEAFPPLNYAKQGSTIDLAFWRVPERLFDEPDEFIVWARAALAAARRFAADRQQTVSEPKSKQRSRPKR
jgi:DNA transformation protein and related proteins